MNKRASTRLLFADWACTRLCLLIFFFISSASRIFKLFHKADSKKKTVFVYANDLLGDTMIKMPFFFSLRKTFPRDDYSIVAVLSPATATSLIRLGLFDEVVEEAPLHWRHPLFWLIGRNGMARSLKWAFRNKADVFIVCHRSRSLGCDFALDLSRPSIAVAYAADTKTPMLPATAKLQAGKYDRKYTHLLTVEDGRHQMEDMDRMLSLTTDQEVKSVMPASYLLTSMLDFSIADTCLKPGYVVLVPGARVEYRRWPVERFIEIANRLKCQIVIVGTAEESELAKTIAAATSCQTMNLCGKTSLAQLGGVLSRARLVLTNETGTASYSAILGTKTICMLGGGDFGAFFPNPYCANTLTVFHRYDCYHCGWKCSKINTDCPKIVPCITAISVDDVASAVSCLLETV